MIRFPARAPWARARAGTFKVTAAMMIGVIRGCRTNPRGSLKGLGMGSVLMPMRLAMSAIGKTVETPVSRSSRAWTGPDGAAVVESEAATVVVSAADEDVVVVTSPPRRPNPNSPPALSCFPRKESAETLEQRKETTMTTLSCMMRR